MKLHRRSGTYKAWTTSKCAVYGDSPLLVLRSILWISKYLKRFMHVCSLTLVALHQKSVRIWDGIRRTYHWSGYRIDHFCYLSCNRQMGKEEQWVVRYIDSVTRKAKETDPVSHEKAIELFHLYIGNHDGPVMLKPYEERSNEQKSG